MKEYGNLITHYSHSVSGFSLYGYPCMTNKNGTSYGWTSDDYIPDVPLDRFSEDKFINLNGRKLLDFCKENALRICNGRVGQDKGIGKYTYVGRTGSSVVDYVLVSEHIFNLISNFTVGHPNILSDHCEVNFSLRNAEIEAQIISDNIIGERLPKKFVWCAEKGQTYRSNIEDNKEEFSRLQSCLNNASSQSDINDNIKQFSKLMDKICDPIFAKNIRTDDGTAFNPNINEKRQPWFDEECTVKRQAFYKELDNFRKNENTENQSKLSQARRDYKKEIRRKRYLFDKAKTEKLIASKYQISRLDYFLISTDIAQYVEEADIGIRYKSDHNPISVKFKFVQQERGRGNWKFNNNLLGDIEYVDLIKTCILETVNQYKVNNLNQENTEPTPLQFSINDQLFWETLKLMIRGKTISYSTYKKRSQNEREKQINEKLIQLYQNFEANTEEIGQLSTELSQIREDRIKGILLRAKVRWKVEGEKSTRYFCNLEKRHFSEKTIPKLIVENKEISDQMAIISEQEKFYKQLYSTKNTTITAEDKTIFFNSDNPFITVLNENEKQSLEGPLTPTEALKSLKEMKNNKSPGIDGFTVEFYKFFWIDLGIYLVRSLNYAYTTQNLSISQKQGIITCIPKEGKSKEYLKNWRPISLLSVDLKIGSASIAARIKRFLQNLSQNHNRGLLKEDILGIVTD